MDYEEIRLTTKPFPNGSTELAPTGEAWVAIYEEIEALREAGTPIYVKYLRGDREGSIARFEPSYVKTGILRGWIGNYSRERTWGFRYEGSAYGTMLWDGRRNKVKEHLGCNFSYLRGYTGPTVWKKFDAKARKSELLANPNQMDINGRVLHVGDAVVYINTRYGGGSKLMHGTVTRFEAKADSQRSEIFTIVTEKDGDMESKITSSKDYIMWVDLPA